MKRQSWVWGVCRGACSTEATWLAPKFLSLSEAPTHPPVPASQAEFHMSTVLCQSWELREPTWGTFLQGCQ